jgi:secondary thiamine-phosphate synthase enzyme
MKNITVSTSQNKEVVDITDKVEDFLKRDGHIDGMVTIFVRHTTCAVSTADLDPGTDLDYLKALEAITPKLNYNHPHDPSHFTDHLLSTIVGTSISIPVENGKLNLGTWQRVVLIEFNGPRQRNISLSFIKE